MTTNTIKDPVPEAKAPDLESRLQLRRTELIRKLREIRTDTRLATAEDRDRLKASLSELAHIIKVGVVDGWASLGDGVKHKLENWLTEAERAVAALDQAAAKRGRS